MWPQYEYNRRRSRGLLSFGPQEKRDIGISVTVLTISFAFAFSNGIYGLRDTHSFLVYTLPVAFLAVITGFFLHEMGHRMLARYYGCWAEFRMWSAGLLLALFTSFAGVVFAAPGAVYISGMINREQNGKISAAGPFMNFLVAVCMFPIIVFADPFIGSIAYFVALINIFLGGFNMIPFPPLDGYKVFKWGILQYLGLLFLIAGAYVVLSLM